MINRNCFNNVPPKSKVKNSHTKKTPNINSTQSITTIIRNETFHPYGEFGLVLAV
jgi:hypothetical protein